MFKKLVPERHFILTNGRSGSNYLVNTINLHPQLVNYGEVLGEWTLPYKLYKMLSCFRIGWESYLDILYENAMPFYFGQLASTYTHILNGKKSNFKIRKQVHSIGIKDFAFLIKKRDLINYLQKSQDLKVIHLYRKNILKRYISMLRMHKTGIVKSETNKPIQLQSIDIDIKEMISQLDVFTAELELEFQIVNELPAERCFSLCYEEYFFSNDSITSFNEKIFNFLGVEPIPITSQQRKISTDKLNESITNYDELTVALKDTPYEKYLTM